MMNLMTIDISNLVRFDTVKSYLHAFSQVFKSESHEVGRTGKKLMDMHPMLRKMME